jgi:Ca2+-transporting ATPase
MKYRIGLFSNHKLILAMAVSILLQIMVIYSDPVLLFAGLIQAPVFGPIFSTIPLGLFDWVEIILVSSTVLVVMWLKEKIFRSEI